MPPRRRGDESSRDELSRLLIALRGHRSQTEVAELAGLTQAKVSRAERGRFPMSVDDARSYAVALGAGAEQLARVAELAEAKIAAHLRGRVSLVRVAAAIQERIDRLEQDSTGVRGWDPAAVVGSLQTTAYTRALFMGDGDGSDPGPAWWAARRRRTDRILEGGRTWHLLIAEAALRWVLGSPQVMADQLAHVLTLAELPHVTLGVLDLGTPKPFAAPRGFHLYGDDVATAATDVGTSFLDDPDDVAHFRTLFDQLADAAVYDERARALVGKIRRAYRR